MQLEEGTLCPILNTDCVKLKCAWFVKIMGVDPNTGKEIDEWNCAIAWMPVLNINTANESRKGAAATESFRNEMVKQNKDTYKQILEHQLTKDLQLKE